MKVIFYITLVLQYLILLGVLWSITFPERRIWPPPNQSSWQHRITWIMFDLGIVGKLLVTILDWNNWIIADEVRFYLGVPIITIGSTLTIWSIWTLGLEATGGKKNELIINGPYRYSRNPQYLGDIIIFIGLILLSNSLHVFIVQVIAILVFMITPLTEESWLKETYQEKYMVYKQNTERFI